MNKMTKVHQAECERISRLQSKAKGEEYLRLDELWTQEAVKLAAARLKDAIKAYKKGRR